MNEFNLQLGAAVHCHDGRCGTLAKIVINPHTFQVKSLIIEEGFLLKRAGVLPITTMQQTQQDELYVQLSSDELHDYPEYRETEFKRSVEGWNEPNEHQAKTVYPAFGAGFAADYDPNVALEETDKIHESIPPELAVVTNHTIVKNAESVWGKLAQVIIDAGSYDITHLIVRPGLIFPEPVNVPISFVQNIDDEEIFLTVTDQEIEQFLETRGEELV